MISKPFNQPLITSVRVFAILALTSLFWCTFSQAITSPDVLTLQDYIHRALLVNRSYQVHNLQVSILAESRKIAGDIWQTDFLLKPYHLYQKQDIATVSSRSDKYSGFETSLTQKLPWGSKLGVSYQKNFDAEENLFDTTKSRITGSISFDIWQNVLGRLDRQRRKKAFLDYQEGLIATKEAKIAVCENAIDLYLNLANLELQMKIMLEKRKHAQEVLKLTERSFRRRLTRKIDLLSARTDFLSSESEYLQTKTKYEKAKIKFKEAINTDSNVAINPLTIREESPIKTIVDDITYAKWNKRIENSVAQIRLTKLQNFKPVELKLELGRTESTLLDNQTTFGQTDRFFKLSVNFQFSLINKTKSANLRKSILEREIAELELAGAKITLNSDLNQISEDYMEVFAEKAMSQKRIKLYNEQLEEAFILLKTGKIEYQDYLIYRDRLYSERIKYLSLIDRSWNLHVRAAKLLFADNLACLENL